ncbi:MAG: 50S ribosomal protein L23 [Ignavibacteria bacterium GWB2_35_6b]|nr:MAG: 50S ribosomal protein L23 [Ignavibacteria bacterium GWB2_35_6b]
MQKLLIRPLVTEKMNGITENVKQYGFVVDVNANKIEIAKAVEKKFSVNVVAVNTIKYKGKTKTQFTRRGRFTGKTPKFKKALVTLKDDQTIDIFGEV